ncbi:unnamed protein product [Alopecurus aequalis]
MIHVGIGSMHGDDTTASASARDKDGEWRGGGFQPAQDRGSTSSSAWRPSDDNGGRWARDIQLAQHRGCWSASGWRGSDGVGDATAGGRPPPQQDVSERPGSSRGGPVDSEMVDRFIEMGFLAEKVHLALEHAGGGRQEEEAVLEWLFTHQETDLEESRLSTDIEGFSSSSSEGVDMADFDDKGLGAELTEKDKKFLYLVEMGFEEDEVSAAITICGEHEPVELLADAIHAAQIARRGGSYGETTETSGGVKRKNVAGPSGDKRRPHIKQLGQVDRAFGSGPMVGFDLPNGSTSISNRKIPDIAKGPPYFYFESVASALHGVQDESRFLRDIKPEFVDSKDFCAVKHKRRYIHNLPTLGRFHIDPVQQRTIQEVFTQTRRWWPPWDTRTQLNCIRTKTAPAAVFKNVRLTLANHLNEFGRKKILDACMDWNLIWVGPNKVAALEPGEVETVLGLPKDYTRGFTVTDRYHALGNSVQVDTIAYHLSALKTVFSSGIKVLSLFSGIGGAELGLYRLGIHLEVVVSLELSKTNQNIIRTWWDQTKQTGELIQIDDVRKVKGDYLQTLVRRFGGFDLIVGGSLEQPSQFHLCSQILAQVKQIMRRV